MKKYTLKRRYFKFGTYSELVRSNGAKVCSFVEREWRNNTPFKSCIPEGLYTAVSYVSPKYGKCYGLMSKTLGVSLSDDTLRNGCLIHIANKPSELMGCLAPGLGFGTVGGEWAVTNSTAAFTALMEEFDGEDVQIEIVKA